MTDQSDAGQSVQPPTNQKAVNRGVVVTGPTVIGHLTFRGTL